MAQPGVREISRRKLLAGMAAGAAALTFPRPGKAAIVSPKLTLILIAEQFRSDYLFRNFNSFNASGFRRLMDESAFFPDCRLLSSSFTLTGLATIATGSYADMHGIVANRWYESAGGKLKVATPSDLEVTTLFQQEFDPANRFFAIAAAESKARLFHPQATSGIFFRKPDSTFASLATAATPEPSWFSTFNQTNAAEKFQNRAWVAHGAPPGTPPLRNLVYDAAKPENFHALLASSPFAQSAEINLVRDLIHNESLGVNSSDTVAAVLDSIGKLGSETGAVSPLIDDEVLSLDADISSLLEWLDARGQSYQIVFTAAHGAPSEPATTSRVAPGEIVAAVEAALSTEFAKDNAGLRFVEAYVYPFLYLRTEHVPPAELPRARQIAGNAALATRRVAGFMTADGYCPGFSDWNQRARNSLYRRRSGDVLLSYKPGFVEYAGVDRGISYGSLWNYDTQVPLLMKGPSFAPERFDHMVELIDIAPTLAAVAGVPPPAACSGRVLTEAFGEGVS
jgi:Type I phosphodiesterase / nucleotide pyrophosphatase